MCGLRFIAWALCTVIAVQASPQEHSVFSELHRRNKTHILDEAITASLSGRKTIVQGGEPLDVGYTNVSFMLLFDGRQRMTAFKLQSIVISAQSFMKYDDFEESMFNRWPFLASTNAIMALCKMTAATDKDVWWNAYCFDSRGRLIGLKLLGWCSWPEIEDTKTGRSTFRHSRADFVRLVTNRITPYGVRVDAVGLPLKDGAIGVTYQRVAAETGSPIKE